MTKRMMLLLLTILLLVAGSVFIAMRNAALGSGFDRTIRGELRSDVIRRLGKPTVSYSNCSEEVVWLDERVASGICAREVRYDAVLLPKYWTIGFDKAGRVVAKYEHVSP